MPGDRRYPSDPVQPVSGSPFSTPGVDDAPAEVEKKPSKLGILPAVHGLFLVAVGCWMTLFTAAIDARIWLARLWWLGTGLVTFIAGWRRGGGRRAGLLGWAALWLHGAALLFLVWVALQTD